MTKLKTLLLGVVVAAAALMPLYGDPRSTPVTHPLWGRMLLRAMEMSEAVRLSDQASQVFGTLSWRDSISFRADRYMRADGVRVIERGGQKCVAAVDGVGEVVYPIALVRAGDYRLRARMSASPAAAPTAEITPFGRNVALRSFPLPAAATTGWVTAGATYLDPGAYTASLLLPPGTELEYVEVAPPCLNPIEPVGGWKPTAIVRNDDVAVTALKALDLENELPPAAPPVELRGEDFRSDEPMAMTAGASEGFEGMWLKGGPKGVRAVVFVSLPEAGLYTVSMYGLSGGGQGWLADGCRKSVVCPGRDPVSADWRIVMTNRFNAGRHSFSVTLAPGAAIERVRFERKKESPADYLATVREMGFDPGPDGPVSQDKAVDGMKWVRDRRVALVEALCGDIELEREAPQTPTVVATATQATAAAAAAPAPTTTVPQPPPPPLLPPDLGNQPPASPVVPQS